jgi:glycine/D-amino acid oxidase-like deaminating enzyme
MFAAASRNARRSHPSADQAPPLTGDARVDACVVGAGLGGMLAAYLLARHGRSVMVLDEGAIGGVHEGFEAAHIAGLVERPYALLEERYGGDGARMAAQSCAAAIDSLEAIVLREHIACDFERLDGYVFAPPGEEAMLEREAAAARRAGVHGVERLARAPFAGSGGACVRYPGQAHFHPVRFLAGLARAIRREGGHIHCGVRCERVTRGAPATLETDAGHRVEAELLVTSAPLAPRQRMPARPAPRIAHVVGLRVPRGSIPRALYWDASDPARWVMLRSQGSGAGEVLLAGGEDPASDDDHTAYRYLALERWARERFPAAREVVLRFTGEVVPAPGLFALHAAPERDRDSLHVAGDEWGTTMTRAMIAALVLRDFALDAELSSAELYLPTPPGARGRGAS